mgnify:CR=1 FL=1
MEEDEEMEDAPAAGAGGKGKGKGAEKPAPAKGKKEQEKKQAALSRAREQAAITGVASGAATVVSILTGHEILRMPTALTIRFWLARADVSGAAHRQAEITRGQLRQVLDRITRELETGGHPALGPAS